MKERERERERDTNANKPKQIDLLPNRETIKKIALYKMDSVSFYISI